MQIKVTFTIVGLDKDSLFSGDAVRSIIDEVFGPREDITVLGLDRDTLFSGDAVAGILKEIEAA